MSEAKELKPLRTGRKSLHSFGVTILCFVSHPCSEGHPSLVPSPRGQPGPGVKPSSTGSQEPPPPSGAPDPDVAGRAGVRFLRSLPSAALAAPEIKIKCGLGREHGVGEAAEADSRWAFILSIVTSPPNLWHFNYSPTRSLARSLARSRSLALPGPEAELTLSSSLGGGGHCLDPQPPACSRRAEWGTGSGGRLGVSADTPLQTLKGPGEAPGPRLASLALHVPCVNESFGLHAHWPLS